MAAATSIPKSAGQTTTSKDGRWRTFHKHAGLMLFIPSGTYYARAKARGKSVRASLETDVFSTAKLRLPDKIKVMRKAPAQAGTFSEARALYEADLDADHTLADGSKRYRKARIAALLKSWPGLDVLRLTKITEPACREWAKRFAAKWDEQNFNNTLGTLRKILERGGIAHDDNPAFKLQRLGVKPTPLQLPEPEQFQRILEVVETAGARQSHDCADLIRFLAFSGCRISEAQKVTWADVDMERDEIRVQNAKRSKTSRSHDLRFVPIIPPMRELLDRLRQEQNPKPEDRVCRLSECQKSLDRACRLVGCHRLTHHSFRHLFASRCIEAGVDIPTVSRWLGHVDGGALAMRVYGHLRREHSAQMAKRVTFSKPSGDNILPLPRLAQQ